MKSSLLEPRAVARARPPSSASTLGATLRSVKLCVVLLVLIAVASIIGTLVPQQHPAEFYPDRYGHFWGGLTLAAGADDLYRAAWFLGLLGLLAVNIVACAVHRFRLRALPFVSGIAHLSMLLVLVGGLVDIVWGQDGFLQLSRGSAVEEYLDRANRPRKLGFRIELADFRVECEPAQQKVLSFKTRRLPEVQNVILDGRREYALRGGHRLRILKDVPEFAEAEGLPAHIRRIEALRGPALQVALVFPDGREERRWLFGANPNLDVNAPADPSVRVAYALEPVPRDYVSALVVREGNATVRGEARSNAPFSYGGYDFTQYSYDERAQTWSALRVTREPGTPLVFAGLALLMAGVCTRVAITLVRMGREPGV